MNRHNIGHPSSQGNNHGKNLVATSAMVGRICPPPLVGIGLMYLKFRCDLGRTDPPCGYIPGS